MLWCLVSLREVERELDESGGDDVTVSNILYHQSILYYGKGHVLGLRVYQ